MIASCGPCKESSQAQLLQSALLEIWSYMNIKCLRREHFPRNHPQYLRCAFCYVSKREQMLRKRLIVFVAMVCDMVNTEQRENAPKAHHVGRCTALCSRGSKQILLVAKAQSAHDSPLTVVVGALHRPVFFGKLAYTLSHGKYAPHII